MDNAGIHGAESGRIRCVHCPWQPVKPAAMKPVAPPGPAPQEGETLDLLINDWWVFQLKGGHRFSTDDLMTAWRAVKWCPEATDLLDIGSGIGSVGLYTLAMLDNEEATLIGVEAQRRSHELAKRSVARNHLEDRVQMLHGDLRDASVLDPERRFELITGSPPYIPIGKGIISPHPQRAACRFELRGSCVDYCIAAARWLKPGGTFAFVMAAADPRIEEGPVRAGLHVLERFDVIFRGGMEPMISVMVCRKPLGDEPAPERAQVTFTVRHKDGTMTDEYVAFRRSLGFSVPH